MTTTTGQTSTLYREDVELLHDVPCHRSNRDSATFEDRNPMGGRCICHHAVWHSCPAPSKGKAMFDSLPSRPTTTAQPLFGGGDTLADILTELRAIRALLREMAGA